MKNKGFTLVELLAVITLMAIISLIGATGIVAVKNSIYENMWNSTVEYIETSAAKYGDDNKNRLKNECVVDGVTRYSCLNLSVQYLINKTYIKTKEVDNSNNKVLINKTISESDNDIENYNNKYYINNTCVYIYLENEVVYAFYDGNTLCI